MENYLLSLPEAASVFVEGQVVQNVSNSHSLTLAKIRFLVRVTRATPLRAQPASRYVRSESTFEIEAPVLYTIEIMYCDLRFDAI